MLSLYIHLFLMKVSSGVTPPRISILLHCGACMQLHNVHPGEICVTHYCRSSAQTMGASFWSSPPTPYSPRDGVGRLSLLGACRSVAARLRGSVNRSSANMSCPCLSLPEHCAPGCGPVCAFRPSSLS